MLVSPPLYHPLDVVFGWVLLRQDPSNNLTDALLGLPVERPTAHLPIDAEEVGNPVGNPPIFVLYRLCYGLASLCYSTSWVIRAVRTNN
jgi:hypothetical protein